MLSGLLDLSFLFNIIIIILICIAFVHLYFKIDGMKKEIANIKNVVKELLSINYTAVNEQSNESQLASNKNLVYSSDINELNAQSKINVSDDDDGEDDDYSDGTDSEDSSDGTDSEHEQGSDSSDASVSSDITVEETNNKQPTYIESLQETMV